MLTRQQELFVRYLAEGDSQRTAYKKAYPKSKALDTTTDTLASRLLAKDEVRTRYEELRRELNEQTKKESIADITEVLESLTRAVRQDPLSFVTKSTDDAGNTVLEANTDADWTMCEGFKLVNGNIVPIPVSKSFALGKLADILNIKEKNAAEANLQQEIKVSFADLDEVDV